MNDEKSRAKFLNAAGNSAAPGHASSRVSGRDGFASFRHCDRLFVTFAAIVTSLSGEAAAYRTV